MARRGDLRRFYALMRRLERIDRRHELGELRERDCPEQGVYFFFEPGEARSGSGSGDRIVRVGSHALAQDQDATLWSRLRKHRGAVEQQAQQRGSVFRNRVGNAICRRNPRLGPENWPHDSHRGDILRIERLIDRHMRPMTVLLLPVGRRAHRDYIERNATALLSEYQKDDSIDRPSRAWLGRRCDREKVRESGLWQSDHVDACHDPEFLDLLERYVERAGERS